MRLPCRLASAATLLACLSLTGCYGFGKSSDATNPHGGPAGITSFGIHDPSFNGGATYGSGQEAFKNTVYRLATAHCGACHGLNQAPKFAVGDVASAYATMLATGKINFSNIPGSALLAPGDKLSDSHCGSYCNGAGVLTWQSAIQAWWTGGECLKTNACGKQNPSGSPSVTPAAGRINTAAQTIPANLPSAVNQFTTLTFALDGLSPDLAGAKFLVDIQQYGSTNAYLLRKPRLTLPSASTTSIYVQDIQVVLNGAIDPNATTYTVVEQVISPPGGQLLSLSPLIITMQKGLGVDQIALSFGALNKSSGACKNTTGFAQDVKPILLNLCAGCHDNQATFRINAADSDDVLCSRALQRVNLAQPPLSPLIRLPMYGDPERGGSAHPKPGLSDADVTTITGWIKTEQ